MGRKIVPVLAVSASIAAAVALSLAPGAHHHRSAADGSRMFALVRRVDPGKAAAPQDCSVSSTPCVRGCTLYVAETLRAGKGQTSPCAAAARSAPCIEPVVAGASYCSGAAAPLFERDLRAPSRRRR
jgi:hypothetical protein